MLPLHLQPESHIPLYVQLRDQLRALADIFYKEGYNVVSVLLPGHGTKPEDGQEMGPKKAWIDLGGGKQKQRANEPAREAETEHGEHGVTAPRRPGRGTRRGWIGCP